MTASPTANYATLAPQAADSTPLLGDSAAAGESGFAHKRAGREGVATLLSTTANLMNTILGTGMLAMPHAFASGGLIPGILTVIWCGLTAGFGLYLLTRSAAEAPHRGASFASLSALSFPSLGRVFDAAIFLKCFGVSISYLIIIGSLCPRVVLSFSPDAPAWLLDRRLYIMLSMPFCTGLAFLRKLDSLKFTSYIALVAVANLVFVVIYKSIDSSGLPPRGPIDLVKLGPAYVSSLPVQIFAFTCAQNIFAVFNELRQNTQPRLNLVIGASIGTATAAYEVLGVLGYLTLGASVGGNIMESYPKGLMVSVAQAGIVIMVLLSYPLQIHPARASLDKAINAPVPAEHAPLDDHADVDIPLVRFVVETSFILLATFLIALFVDSLETVLGFVGATGSTMISFILPAVFFLAIFKDSTDTRDKVLIRPAAWGLLVWGVAVMVVSLSLNVYHIVGKPEGIHSLHLLDLLGGKKLPSANLPQVDY